MKKYVLELFDFELFFFKRNFSDFSFFPKKMLVVNFMRFRRKKNCKLRYVHQNCKTKKFARSKILNKKIRKIHYFAKIKYKRNARKYCEKNLRRNIFVKRKIFAKKNLCKKIFVKKIYRKNKSKKIL